MVFVDSGKNVTLVAKELHRLSVGAKREGNKYFLQQLMLKNERKNKPVTIFFYKYSENYHLHKENVF